MGKKRYFDSDFWTDTWVVDHINQHDRYLFIYLFTNPLVTLSGVYEISLRIMSFQTGIESDELKRMLDRLQPKISYVDGWIILRNGIKNQNYKNEKIKQGILTSLEGIPDKVLQHLAWPHDFSEKPKKKPEQTKIIDDSSMTLDDSSHLIKSNSIQFNLIKSNSAVAEPAAAASPRVSVETEKQRKRHYARAVRADEAQAERDGQAKQRLTGQPQSLAERYAEVRANRERGS